MKDKGDGFGLIRNRFRDGAGAWDAVAKRRPALVAAPQGLFRHAAEHVAGEADGIKFIHPLNDALNQAAEGPVRQWFGDADHLYGAGFLQHGFVYDTFLLVPGKAGKFPYQDQVERVFRGFGGGDHPLKLRTAVGTAAGNAIFQVNVDGIHGNIVGAGVV